jgi:hypothetical protein
LAPIPELHPHPVGEVAVVLDEEEAVTGPSFSAGSM